MRVFVIGAGQVGSTIVEALHDEHEITVLDTEASRLQALTRRFDVAVFEGDGTSRKDLAAAGIDAADLVIACTSRDEVNLVAGMFARREAEGATTVIRTSSIEYVELWREGQLDVDFVVSSELETAYAISRILGVPAARQTDVFADGQVQLGEFDVDEDASSDVLGVPLPRRRDPGRLEGRGDHPGRRHDPSRRRRRDRDTAIASSSSARPRAVKAWSALLWPGGGAVRDVVIYGAGRVGSAIARVLLVAGDQRADDRGLARAGAARRGGAPEGARLQRDRLRRRLPRARAHRPVAGRDLRDARRREEPVRGSLARAGARDSRSPSRSPTTRCP